MKLFYLLYFTTLLTQHIAAQQFDLKEVDNKRFYTDCGKFNNIFFQKPKEVQIGVVLNPDNQMVFVATSKDWFFDLINSRKDGITIDIVTKDIYECKKPSPGYKNKIFQKGYLLEPVYKKEIEKNAIENPDNMLVYNFGPLPPQFKDKPYEFNMVFINDKRTCLYHNFYNIKQYRWDLLDMGIYEDTIISSRVGEELSYQNTKTEMIDYLSKVMIFTISFLKNKVEYEPNDVLALHDSLNSTDYYIKSIIIHSYSSIEGTEEKNLDIQKKRANSIVKALQSYQKPDIITQIFVNENWSEFFEDIQGTSFKFLENLSKSEIKEKLKDIKILEQLEPKLKEHRKAILKIELSKINKYESFNDEQLINAFNISVQEENIKKAQEIQKVIFENIKTNKSSDNILDKIEIPNKIQYSLLHSNQSIFEYAIKRKNQFETYTRYEELAKIFPNDIKILHNKLVFKFKAIVAGFNIIDPLSIDADISTLAKLKDNPALLKKLRMNYYILMSEVYFKQGNYIKKDEMVNMIMKQYNQSKLDPVDVLSLAQYLVSYNNVDKAIGFITPFCKKTGVDEDLLYYFINLTIINENQTKDKNYKKILHNAATTNRERFCELFEPNHKDGITFQLLESTELKKLYCDYCK